MRTASVLFVLLLLGACRESADPAMMAELDGMILRVDSLTDRLNMIDTERCDRMDSAFRHQRDGIEALLVDTITKDTAMIIGNYYRAMNKSLGRVRKQWNEVHEELKKSRKQIEDLRHDLDRRLLPDGPKNTYFQQELLILDELDRNVNVLERSYATAVREWDDKAEQVERILSKNARDVE
ncbi:MAG: hypothetical protein KDB88_11370 [Flavobacteriales bacterium]|nr:hypothetical protein [Flavobacteriales bacterium]